MKSLTIVLPARNEESVIKQTLTKLEKTLKAKHKVIVVNDHSTDSTKKVIQTLSKKYKNIKVIDNERDPGFANTILSGFDAAKSDLVLPMMADLCDDPKTIPLMLKKIDEGYDIVVGSRYMKEGKKIGEQFLKDFSSRTVGFLCNKVIGLNTSDATNSFKIYKKEVLKNVKVKSKGFTISMEIPLKAHFKGYKISEVPTTWIVRKEGKSKFSLFKMAPDYLALFIGALIKKIIK